MPRIPMNLDDVPAPEALGAVPAGWYTCKVSDSQTTVSRAGHEMLVVELTIHEGEHAGRKLWDRLNLWHPDPKVSEIAARSLKALAVAAGRPNLQETEEIHEQLVEVKVAVRDDQSGQYEPSNAVRSYRAASNVAKPPVGMTPPPAAAQAKPAATPWAR
jgi:hypothetical protein